MMYDAFISYSHAEDSHLAPALQSALHKFAKPWYKLRAVRVFRDETNLASETSLPRAIETAMANSRFFILFASEGAAHSKWVAKELDFWLKGDKTGERLLVVLTRGDIAWDDPASDFDWQKTNALPANLKGRLKEPLYVDLRWAKTGEQASSRDPRFQSAVARIAARLHGKSLDEIAGQEVQEHRRTKRVAWAAVTASGLFAVFWLVAAVTAMNRQEKAERNLREALKGTDMLVDKIAEGMKNARSMQTVMVRDVLVSANQTLDQLAKDSLQRSLVPQQVRSILGLRSLNVTHRQVLARRAKSLLGMSWVHYRTGCMSTAAHFASEAVSILEELRSSGASDDETLRDLVRA